jgi:tetratricopeptide (TPR) repeat protein
MPPNQPKGTNPNSISAIVQNFKSVSTRRINHKGLLMPTLIQTSSRVLGGALLIFVCTSCIIDIGKSLDASADPVPSKPAKRTESMKEKEYAQKIAKLSRRIDQNPKDAEALYQRAIAYLELNSIKESDGNWAQAEEDLTQVILLDPGVLKPTTNEDRLEADQKVGKI